MSQKEYRKFELVWAGDKIVDAMGVLDKVEVQNPKNEDLLADVKWHLYSALVKIKQLKRTLR